MRVPVGQVVSLIPATQQVRLQLRRIGPDKTQQQVGAGHGVGQLGDQPVDRDRRIGVGAGHPAGSRAIVAGPDNALSRTQALAAPTRP